MPADTPPPVATITLPAAEVEALRRDLERVSFDLQRGSRHLCGLQKLCREAASQLDDRAQALATYTHPTEVTP